ALTLGTASAATAAGARSPYVSEIAKFVYPENAAASPANFVYMPDGQSYLTLSPDHRSIVRFDTKSGKEIETFVDLTNTRETTLPDIEGFKLSENGAKVLVYRNRTPIYRRSFSAEYYVYEVRTRILRPLSEKHSAQRSPLFSPDGRMVSFVADNNIYIKKLDYNTEVAVTEDGRTGEIINGVSDWTYEEEFATTCSMAFSPDNLTLCFVKYNEKEVPTYTLPIYGGTCNADQRYALYPGVYSYKYPVAGEQNSRVSLHSYDIETRKVKDIPFADQTIEYIPNIQYAPGGNVLIVPTLNRDQNRLEIYSVNPKSTVVKSVYVEKSETWIAPETYENIYFSQDNFTVLSSRSGFAHLYQYSYAGAELRQLTSGDFDVTAYYGTDALGNHYYQAALPTPLDRTVKSLDKKGAVHTVSPEKGWSIAAFSPAKEYMMLNYSDVSTPPVYSLCNASGKTLRTLEDNSAYRARYEGKIPAKEFFTVESDGYALNGYMIKPLDFNSSKRYPVVMTQYSGPGSQSVVNRWQMDFDYFYALKGYIVVCVDGRGTGGRGRAFTDMVYKQLGHYETIDQIATANYLAGLPFVDRNAIGISGWSYGGYEALMCATEPSSPFSATVAIAPVTDWRFYDTVYA
ncbi:MAG: S9 family peptidase, partial [Muribaculaceae bacterium]|nr:S9 family peptidase [Muribaculaceae bacterium]